MSWGENMKINNGNIHALYLNSYKTNEKVTDIKKISETKESMDTCQLSAIGKKLNQFAIEDESFQVSDKMVENIKNQVKNGTYTVDTTVLAKAMLGKMKGGQ